MSGTARLQISAVDGGHEAIVTVEDYGVGVDPGQLAGVLAGRWGGDLSDCATSTSGCGLPSGTTTG